MKNTKNPKKLSTQFVILYWAIAIIGITYEIHKILFVGIVIGGLGEGIGFLIEIYLIYFSIKALIEDRKIKNK